MKIPTLLLVTVAALLLSVIPALRAGPSVTARKRAQIATLVQDQDACRLAFREMMKDRDKKRYMAHLMARDAEAREFFNAEVGNDGPHEERNPSQHPELFQSKKP